MNEQLILQKLDAIGENVSEIKVDISGLKSDVSGLKFYVSELKSDVSELKTDVSELKVGFKHLLRNQNDLIEIVGDIKDNMITKADLVSRPFWRSIL